METVLLIHPLDGIYNKIMPSTLPLALLSIAAPLVKENYKVKIIDQRVNLEWKKTLKEALKENPICVGITSMTGSQINFALEASKIVKENSNVPVIWGGVHVSLFPKQTLKNKYIDIGIMKEGENTFLELINTIKQKKSIDKIKGIVYKKEGEIIITSEREFTDLNKLPKLPYYLVDMRKYVHKSFKQEKVIDIETSRGCPYACGFCYNSFYNKSNWRSMSPEKVIENLKILINNYNIKSFYFIDDNFFANQERANKIMNLIVSENLNIIFGCQGIRIDSLERMTEDELNLLEKAGCKFMQIGVESGSDRVLKLINKRITREQVINVNKKLANHNILVLYNFICGFPTETKEDLFQTTSLIHQILNDNKNAMAGPVYIYKHYPGTVLYDLAISQGFKQPENLEEWANFDWTRTSEFNQSKEMLKLFKKITIASICIDDKIESQSESFIYRTAAKIYKPIARLRIKHNFYGFMPETFLLGNKIK